MGYIVKVSILFKKITATTKIKKQRTSSTTTPEGKCVLVCAFIGDM